MLSYLERVHEGARGIVTDAVTGSPLAASVHVAGNPYPTHADPDVCDWHRVMAPGTYDLEISAPGHVTRLLSGVVVKPGDAVRVDAALRPLATDLQPVAGCVDSGSACEPWVPVGAASELTVTLRNAGDDATAVTGRLESIGWFATAAGAGANYPDIAAGAEGDSAAPGHAIEVSATAPVGHKAGFVVRWTSAEGAGVSDPLFLPVDARTCVSVAATGLPVAIADRTTIESSLDILDDLEISDVEVTVDVTHTYRNDLRVDLVSPAGTVVVLHNRSGGSADDIAGVFGVDLTPFVPLSRVDGESSAGTWSLRVDDGVPGNTGSLEAWSAKVCGRPFEASTPEMRLADVERTPGGVAISWWPYPGMSDYRVYRSSDPSQPGGFIDVTAEDPDPTDTRFEDVAAGDALYWIVTGVGPRGEGPKGHFGE